LWDFIYLFIFYIFHQIASTQHKSHKKSLGQKGSVIQMALYKSNYFLIISIIITITTALHWSSRA